MKGLLVKDFCLLLQRKRFFLILAFCAFFMLFSMDNAGFVVAYLCMIMTFFALSSMSYDEYDNCMPFLMSMPVTAKDYAVEKYLFGFLCGLAGWLFALVVMLLFSLVRQSLPGFVENFLSSLVFLLLSMLMLALSLPLQLKWGSEKGRMVLFLIFGIFAFGFVFASRLFPEGATPDIGPGNIGVAVLLLAVIGIVAIAFAISMLISIRIVRAKEF